MSKVLVALICYLYAFNFGAKAGNESESGETKGQNVGENNAELLKPLVLIVDNANMDKVFNVDPDIPGVPFKSMKMQDTDVHSNKLPPNEHKFYLCPQRQLKEILEPSYSYPTHVEYCLFVTKFDADEPKECAHTPKNVIVTYKLSNSGLRYGRFVIKLCYPVIKNNQTTECYTKGIRKFFTKKIPVVIKHNYLNLYDFVYNEEEERTEWTTQTVIPMSTLWSFTLQPDKINISGSAPDILQNSFDLLIKTYNAQDKTKPHWLAHRLAQPTQYPFNIMMAATSEIINTAPLQNKLQPLIYLIEERIQKLSDHISKPLKVMTKPLYHQIDQHVEELYLDRNRKFLIPNVWSKQVFEEATNTGIVIIVHNYPEYVPSEGLLCEQKAYCNFQKWKTESSQFKDAFDETLIKFAYCCKEAKFPIMEGVNIKKVVDINFDFTN